jgi:C-terminal processing protease CtpA/Prc
MKTTVRTIAMWALVAIFASLSISCRASVFFDGFNAASTTPQAVAAGNVAAQQLTPDEYYHKAWELVRDNSLYRDRLTNWSSWEHKYDGQLKNFADAEKAIREMLGSLKDDYTYFKDKATTTADQTRGAAQNVVSYKMLPGKIGYIKIDNFSSNNTSEEVEKALKALSGADAYVIDLRDNRGGYVREAFHVFSMLVDQGTFTVLKGHYDGKPYTETLSVTATELVDDEVTSVSKSPREPNLTGNKPLVVLVNANSASASEMLSGALRDNKRAELVGVKTFGKGIAQITWEIGRGTSVQVTFAAYELPGGTAIHGKGITPDIVVAASKVGDTQLDAGVAAVNLKLGR